MFDISLKIQSNLFVFKVDGGKVLVKDAMYDCILQTWNEMTELSMATQFISEKCHLKLLNRLVPGIDPICPENAITSWYTFTKMVKKKRFFVFN